MDEVDEETIEISWPSVDDAKPAEEGGPNARVGFNYQDEIAVWFLIQMLEDPLIVKIHCETHDDIVLVRQFDCGLRIAEYIQVKSNEQDQLWSIANLCAQKESGRSGTSIFEASLGRDRHSEEASFRIVTLRPVVSALKPLTFAADAPDRAPGSDRMVALHKDIETRLPDIQSPKGNGSKFWLERCRWDERHSEEAVRNDNVRRLLELSRSQGKPLLIDQADILLDELRARAKSAGSAKWGAERSKKIITREALSAWWEGRSKELVDGAAAKSGGKLASKMEDALLPADMIALAVELRLEYAAETRTPRYLQTDDAARIRRRVQSEISTLRARYVSGQIAVEPAEFHALCLERMDTVSAELASTLGHESAFLKGCMYDIADRCLLRFTGGGS
jgi:hypothetical protein